MAECVEVLHSGENDSERLISGEPLCLTVNDYIYDSDGAARLYRPIPAEPIVLVQENENESAPRLDDLTECVSKRLNNRPLSSVTHESLPPGKLYHVFFSHCNEDRQWVREVVEKLESPDYGFKCCFADRDFDLGVPVFQNITKCIHSSKRTVIILSPEFLESPWCSYETRITLELDLDTRQRLLIPVMLKECKVPDFIGRLSYIEVKNEHFWERFISALKDEDTCASPWMGEMIGSSAIMACNPFQYNPNFYNTEEITELMLYVGFSCPSNLPTDVMPDELMRHGIQLTSNKYTEIVEAISKQCYVRRRWFYNKGPYFAIAMFFSVFGIPGLIIVPDKSHNLVIIMSIIIAMLAVFSIICFLRYLFVAIAIFCLTRATEKANKVAFSCDLLICFKDYGCNTCNDKISIIFKYYDWRPCLSKMKEILRSQISQPSVQDEDNTSDERMIAENDNVLLNPEGDNSVFDIEIENPPSVLDVEEAATTLLIKMATEYGELLLEKRAATPSEQRHTRQKECLCQYAESILESGQTSCLDRLYGVRTRHPWRRLLLF